MHSGEFRGWPSKVPGTPQYLLLEVQNFLNTTLKMQPLISRIKKNNKSSLFNLISKIAKIFLDEWSSKIYSIMKYI